MAFPTHIVAAAGYVFDKNGNMLLVKTHHRGWDCTGGQIEAGESIEDGVLREILEESGVRASVRSLVGIYSNVSSYIWHDNKTPVPTKVMFDFICEYIGGELASSDETSGVIWVPKENVMDYITLPVLRMRFENVLQFDGRICYCSYATRPEFKLLSERYFY
jgi:ADP-ribose pyrophosphatase YjhB (NUDIX family)